MDDRAESIELMAAFEKESCISASVGKWYWVPSKVPGLKCWITEDVADGERRRRQRRRLTQSFGSCHDKTAAGSAVGETIYKYLLIDGRMDGWMDKVQVVQGGGEWKAPQHTEKPLGMKKKTQCWTLGRSFHHQKKKSIKN